MQAFFELFIDVVNCVNCVNCVIYCHSIAYFSLINNALTGEASTPIILSGAAIKV